jgi:hypothetical protein
VLNALDLNNPVTTIWRSKPRHALRQLAIYTEAQQWVISRKAATADAKDEAEYTAIFRIENGIFKDTQLEWLQSGVRELHPDLDPISTKTLRRVRDTAT